MIKGTHVMTTVVMRKDNASMLRLKETVMTEMHVRLMTYVPRELAREPLLSVKTMATPVRKMAFATQIQVNVTMRL